MLTFLTFLTFFFLLKYADQVREPEYPAFLTYCEIWAEFLHEHHDVEELISFPFLQKFGKKYEDVILELNGEHKTLIPSIEGMLSVTTLPPTSV